MARRSLARRNRKKKKPGRYVLLGAAGLGVGALVWWWLKKTKAEDASVTTTDDPSTATDGLPSGMTKRVPLQYVPAGYVGQQQPYGQQQQQQPYGQQQQQQPYGQQQQQQPYGQQQQQQPSPERREQGELEEQLGSPTISKRVTAQISGKRWIPEHVFVKSGGTITLTNLDRAAYMFSVFRKFPGQQVNTSVDTPLMIRQLKAGVTGQVQIPQSTAAVDWEVITVPVPQGWSSTTNTLKVHIS